jgi:hypothetical protein
VCNQKKVDGLVPRRHPQEQDQRVADPTDCRLRWLLAADPRRRNLPLAGPVQETARPRPQRPANDRELPGGRELLYGYVGPGVPVGHGVLYKGGCGKDV